MKSTFSALWFNTAMTLIAGALSVIAASSPIFS